MKMQLRKSWLIVHRWLGLVAGLLFVLLGLTGSLLVFDHAIDEWLNPELLLTTGRGTPRPYAAGITAAELAYAGERKTAVALSSPRVTNGVWTVWFQDGTEEKPIFAQVYVDPYSAKVTGQRVFGEDLMGTIYRLHYTLLGGNAGETVVGVAGILLMMSIASGVYLWWPLWQRSCRAAFAIRPGRRFNYDLHKTVGVASTPVLLIIAFTGVYMTFPSWIKPIVTTFSSETKPPENLRSANELDDRFLAPEQAIAIAKELFPSAEFDHYHPPLGSRGVYEIGLRQPNEVQRSFGRTQVWIDPFDGRVLAVRDPKHYTAADSFVAWQFPLHNGEAFGLVGRWIVFFSGLLPAVLYVTGLTLWLRSRSPRRRRSTSFTDSFATPIAPASPSLSPGTHFADREPWSSTAPSSS